MAGRHPYRAPRPARHGPGSEGYDVILRRALVACAYGGLLRGQNRRAFARLIADVAGGCYDEAADLYDSRRNDP